MILWTFQNMHVSTIQSAYLIDMEMVRVCTQSINNDKLIILSTEYLKACFIDPYHTWMLQFHEISKLLFAAFFYTVISLFRKVAFKNP